MRFFLIIAFILSIKSSVFANEIKSVTIEGATIGDSALNFFSEDEIKKVIITDWKSKKYERSEIKSKKFNKFDLIQISYLSDDKEFKIAEIKGLKKFKYSKCIKEINQMSKKIKKKIPDTQIQPSFEYENKWDTFGESKTTDIIIAINSKNKSGVLDTITLFCYQYSDGYKKEMNLSDDDLGIRISSKEFDKFLFIEAYK